MDNKEYQNQKLLYSYNLYKNHKFFKKARAVVIKDGKLLVIKVTYLEDGKIHYLLPGGGIDDGETVKQAVVRETLEEYNDNVEPIKYLGKQYYTIFMKKDGDKFPSHRVEYFYICKYLSTAKDNKFGIEGEFLRTDRVYEKVSLSLEELKQLHHKDLNDMDNNNYQKLISYMEELNKK